MVNEQVDWPFLASCYQWARKFVVAAGYEGEIEWQRSRVLAEMTDSSFISEAAWVILSGGMREAVITRVFPLISSAFLEWSSSRDIAKSREQCLRSAYSHFRHLGKLQSICDLCEVVADCGIDAIRDRLENEGADYLQSFGYLGPATSCHLAKNLGIKIAKPDRHLIRVAEAAGVRDVECLCRGIGDCVGDSASVVDVVIWRFATLHPDYRKLFARPQSRGQRSVGSRPRAEWRVWGT